MADEKSINYIGFQQGVNFGDNITLPPGSTYRSGGVSAAMERKKYYDQMRKEAADAGMSLKDYIAKVKREMDEMDAMMNGGQQHSDATDAEYVEVVDEVPQSAVPQNTAPERLSDDDVKRKGLERTNDIFMRIHKEHKVDMLAIYNHIKEHFLSRLTNQYLWVAVYIYFKPYLEKVGYTDFCTQMMNDVWFGEFKNERKKACKNEALGTYTACILELDTDKWSVTMPNADSEMSPRAISAIRAALIELKVEGEGKSFYLKENEGN